MNFLSNKNGFLGIDNRFNFKEKVVVVPFGLEKTVSYGGGTKNGPKEIIKASHQVELFDEELDKPKPEENEWIYFCSKSWLVLTNPTTY